MSSKLFGALAAVAVLASPAAALACKDKASTASVQHVTVDELASLTQQKKAVAVDANGADFRQQNGVIPGAVLLTSSSQFDPARELPAAKDQALVFYCANTKCGASHQAAKKAQAAGYTHVSVLPEGLLGWKAAGKPTQSVPAPRS